jgi:hypothetical protein
MHRLLTPLLAAIVLPACTGYDFAKARHVDGSPDLPKLIADLKASGEDELEDGVWVPLVHMDVTTFEASKPHFPPGYTLTRIRAYGPLFAYADVEKTIVDEQGQPIETDDLNALGLGLLWYSRDSRIETSSGPRLQDRWRVALLVGNDDDVLYLRNTGAPANQPR